MTHAHTRSQIWAHASAISLLTGLSIALPLLAELARPQWHVLRSTGQVLLFAVTAITYLVFAALAARRARILDAHDHLVDRLTLAGRIGGMTPDRFALGSLFVAPGIAEKARLGGIARPYGIDHDAEIEVDLVKTTTWMTPEQWRTLEQIAKS